MVGLHGVKWLPPAADRPVESGQPSDVSSIWRTPDQDRKAPCCRPVISRSQGAEWKALISMYIQSIPLSGDASCAAQNIFCWPPPRTPVSSAIAAKVGAAA